MTDENQEGQVLRLEALIRETSGNAHKTRLLAERILHELLRMSSASRRSACENGSEKDGQADTEPAWRRAA